MGREVIMEKMLYVTLYVITSAYGGPEEGGWYYDHYDYECWFEVPTGHNQQAKIRQAKKLLQEMYEDAPFYYEIFVEKKIGSHDTKEKPIYC
jgi:hypothetical protein